MAFKSPHLKWMNHLSPVRILVIFYLLAVIVATIALSVPFIYLEGVKIPFIDILFTAVSALTVTGLSSISIADTYNTAGIIVIALILQLGMIGIMTLGTFIWLLLGRRIGLQERRLIATDQNQTTFKGMTRLIKQIVIVLLTIELISFLILGTYMFVYYPTAKEAYLHGFFVTISAISNGGFDITGNSLIPYKHDYFILTMNMGLIVLGAIGFPVLIEVKEYILAQKNGQKGKRFSLFTKVTTITFFCLIIVGTIGIFLLDWRYYFADYTWHENFFYSLFQSITTRSGGLSTLDVSQLTEQNHLFMALLMFIGASPSSAGGGIRTTTFALVIIFLITFARGGRSIRLFNREIYDEDLMKAVAVTLMAIILMCSSIIIMTMIEQFTLADILFEVTSAFGTVGLSLGITNKLSIGSKMILMVLMFIGRIGIISFLFVFKNQRKSGRVNYPKERIIIG